MWEVSEETQAPVPPERVWALWEDPARWTDWNHQLADASLQGEFAEGSTARIRFKHSPVTMRFLITALKPGTLFIDETSFPGARMGHEHRVEPHADGSLIQHRLYIDGPLERLYVALVGRQMRSAVKTFGPREAELAALSSERATAP